MKIIVGHTNMDLDCLGSIVLAKYLYPDHELVKSRLVHPVAKNLQNLYQNRLNFLNPKDLKDQHIEKMVIVDTRTFSRVKEYFQFIDNDDIEYEIYDHHPKDEVSFENATLHATPCGSNTSQLGWEIMQREIRVSAEDATIALTGIYADTGNFTHENVAQVDFDVAGFLLKSGASLKLVKTFLKPLSDKYQITLFHELLNRLEYRSIHGHQVITSYWEIENEAEGIGAVVEKVFEVENQDVYFGVFHFAKKKKTLIIARNQKDNIHLNEILKDFGGGGHEKAASATVKNERGKAVYDNLLMYLEKILAPAVTAAEIMSQPVEVIDHSLSLLEASKYMEKISHTGLPVVDTDAHLVGFLTLRDIMKGRRAEQMHAPIKGYMNKRLITASPDVTIRQVEELLFGNNIGHLPIVIEGQIVGIVTRTDYLNYRKAEDKQRQATLQNLGLEVKEPLGSY
jgi:tRNA nucleotidyltransferase (CCA-adding enzyme)